MSGRPPGRGRWLLPHGRAPVLLAIALALTVLSGSVIATVGTTRGVVRDPSWGAFTRSEAITHGVGLVLTLVPSPQQGSAPLAVNVTATLAGGVPPYSLTLCFGASDHTSPTGDCDAPISGWTGAAPVVVGHRFASVGNFSILGLANDSAGESVGSSSLVVVGPMEQAPVILSVDEQTTSGAAPLSVTFNESVAGNTTAIALDWSFGDGSQAVGRSGEPITHVYTTAGTYTPVLRVTDASSHQSSDELPAITVTPGRPAPLGIVPGLSPAAGAELIAAFGIAAVASALGVYALRRRRWRREGDELVSWLRAEDPRARTPPRAP